ncbi:hypothetical protein BRD08_02805 [Halobacteriales archaeon SW_10_66_29]|nr:MAG: hypothetical protein BRD08_02805 [Halobacteriales archaeon SW_10_66_29]
MGEFTLVKLHLDEGSFSANLPFSGQSGSDGSGSDGSGSVIGSDDDEGAGVEKEKSGGPGKGAAALGVLLVLILGTVVVKYLSGDDDEEVAIETADDRPVGVSVDTDEK